MSAGSGSGQLADAEASGWVPACAERRAKESLRVIVSVPPADGHVMIAETAFLTLIAVAFILTIVVS